jgi:hypothetical protein
MRDRTLLLLYIALAAMELSYLYLLGSLLDGPVYRLVLVLLLYPIALVMNRWDLPYRLRFPLEIIAVTVIVLAVAGGHFYNSLAAGHADAAGILLRAGLCGLTWWLGHSVPGEDLRYPAVALRLQAGIIAILVLSQITGLVMPAILFFLLAPPVLLLAAWAGSLGRGAALLGSVRPGHLLLAAGSAIVPGAALVFILSPKVARTLLAWLGNVLSAFSGWIVGQQSAEGTPHQIFSFSCAVRPEASSSLPEPVPSLSTGGGADIPAVVWIIAAAVLLALLVLIALTLRKNGVRRRSRPGRVAARISAVSAGSLLGLFSFLALLPGKLWHWFISLWKKFKKGPAPSAEPLLSVRALYRSLLRWAEGQGLARPPAQTPLEHLGVLSRHFPERETDLRLVTEAYLIARYSREPTPPEVFDLAAAAWQRTQSAQ